MLTESYLSVVLSCSKSMKMVFLRMPKFFYIYIHVGIAVVADNILFANRYEPQLAFGVEMPKCRSLLCKRYLNCLGNVCQIHGGRDSVLIACQIVKYSRVLGDTSPSFDATHVRDMPHQGNPRIIKQCSNAFPLWRFTS
jgi:hypothetical protein